MAATLVGTLFTHPVRIALIRLTARLEAHLARLVAVDRCPRFLVFAFQRVALETRQGADRTGRGQSRQNPGHDQQLDGRLLQHNTRKSICTRELFLQFTAVILVGLEGGGECAGVKCNV